MSTFLTIFLYIIRISCYFVLTKRTKYDIIDLIMGSYAQTTKADYDNYNKSFKEGVK